MIIQEERKRENNQSNRGYKRVSGTERVEDPVLPLRRLVDLGPPAREHSSELGRGWVQWHSRNSPHYLQTFRELSRGSQNSFLFANKYKLQPLRSQETWTPAQTRNYELPIAEEIFERSKNNCVTWYNSTRWTRRVPHLSFYEINEWD